MRFQLLRPRFAAALLVTTGLFVGLLAGVAAVVVGAGQAVAFTPTVTCTDFGLYRCEPGETPQQVRWRNRCVDYHVNESGSADIPGSDDGRISQELLDTVIGSFETWNQPVGSDLELIYAGLTEVDRTGYETGKRNTNVVTWLEDGWPYASKTAYALTSVTFDPTTGLIVDADVELNAAFHTFTDADNPRATLVDVRNTLVHEAGHFLGLDHSPIPEATMYASAPEAETQKRTLHQDDIEGLIHIYPALNEGERSCDSSDNSPEPPGAADDGGAACASTGAAGPAQSALPTLLFLALVIGLVRLRRRR